MQVDHEMKSIQESVLPQLQEIDENQIPQTEVSIERVQEAPPEVNHLLPTEEEKNATNEVEQQASIAEEKQASIAVTQKSSIAVEQQEVIDQQVPTIQLERYVLF